MSQQSDNSPDSRHNRWQFSIGGMLLFTLSVAIAAAVAGTNEKSWSGILPYVDPIRDDPEIVKTGLGGGLFAFLFFWIVLGVIYQIRDLRSILTSNHNLITEHRWGARLEIFWRLATTLLITSFVLMAFLIDRGAFKLSEWNVEANFLLIGDTIHEAVWVMLLIMIIGSIPYVRREQPSSLLHRGLLLVFYVVAVVICLVTWMKETVIHHLVHISILGDDYAMPGKFSAINANSYNTIASQFFWWSLISGTIVVANLAILARLARQWSIGIRRRLLWTGLLIAGILATSAFVIWTKTRGLWEISPYFAKVENQAPLHCWIAASLLVLILTTVMTYRITIDHDPNSNTPQIKWRQNPNKYYHEWRTILLFMIITVVWYHLNQFGLLQMLFSQTPSHPNMEIVGWLILPTPLYCLWICLILVAIHRTFARREDPKYTQTELPRINPARFLTVWFATLAVIISGIPTLVWMSFALWFNPWWRGR